MFSDQQRNRPSEPSEDMRARQEFSRLVELNYKISIYQSGFHSRSSTQVNNSNSFWFLLPIFLSNLSPKTSDFITGKFWPNQCTSYFYHYTNCSLMHLSIILGSQRFRRVYHYVIVQGSLKKYINVPNL